jgi:hypothetical protein
MDTAGIEREVRVRYRDEGHVRFSMPAALANAAAAVYLKQRLLDLDGVHRVDGWLAERKFSVRWHPALCSLRQIALRMREAIREAAAAGLIGEAAAAPPAVPPAVEAPAAAPAARRARTAFGRWLDAGGGGLRERVREWRARASALKSYARAKRAGDARLAAIDERAVINFLNDITAFYLVKVHWNLITQRWTKAPFAHRYEWLTLSYLVFLLVRYRKQAAKK